MLEHSGKCQVNPQMFFFKARQGEGEGEEEDLIGRRVKEIEKER